MNPQITNPNTKPYKPSPIDLEDLWYETLFTKLSEFDADGRVEGKN